MSVTVAKAQGWAKIELLVMKSEQRTKDWLKIIMGEQEKRLRQLEDNALNNGGEHRDITKRLDTHKDMLEKLDKRTESIQDAMIIGRLIAALVRFLRGAR